MKAESVAGRKSLKPEDRTKFVAARIAADVHRKLQQLAAKRGRGLSYEIQQALDFWIKAQPIDRRTSRELTGIFAQLGSLIEAQEAKAEFESEPEAWRQPRRSKHTLKIGRRK